MASVAEVLCPDFQFHTGCNYPKPPGSLVMLGNNHGPVYEVVHVEGATAWIRLLSNGAESLVRLDRLRVVDCPSSGWPVI